MTSKNMYYLKKYLGATATSARAGTVSIQTHDTRGSPYTALIGNWLEKRKRATGSEPQARICHGCGDAPPIPCKLRETPPL